jgi:hypothetical protein
MTQGKEHEEERILSPGSVDARLDETKTDAADLPFLDPHIQEQLGRVFRSFCDDLIHQPIPDKFVVLLAQLEAKQRERK